VTWRLTPCEWCGGEKPRGRGRRYCDTCRDLRAVGVAQRKCDAVRASASHHPDHKRDIQLRWLYGITLEQYKEMDRRQGGCAVCGRSGHTKHPLHVDHCHTTGRIRALLCAPCNTALGMLGEDPERIQALADYILNPPYAEIGRHRNQEALGPPKVWRSK
jgi:hypothetical protein